MSQFFPSGGQSIGVSASASVLSMNIQDWFHLGLTGLILLSTGFSRVFSSTTVWKHQLYLNKAGLGLYLDRSCVLAKPRCICLQCISFREKAMATHSSALAWKVLWTEEPGGLLPMGSHRVGHNWSDSAAAAFNFILATLISLFQTTYRFPILLPIRKFIQVFLIDEFNWIYSIDAVLVLMLRKMTNLYSPCYSQGTFLKHNLVISPPWAKSFKQINKMYMIF